MNLSSFVHILNPNQKNLRRVQKYFQAHPELNAVWVKRTLHPFHLETIVQWALIEGKSHIAIWGGDGSLSRVIQKLFIEDALSKTTIMIVPVGTGNDFARKMELSWPQDGDGEIISVDVGLLQGPRLRRTFINNSGFGRTAKAVYRKRPNALKDILGFSSKKIKIEWENAQGSHFETIQAFLGIFFNAPFFNRGMHFFTDGDPQDGSLNAVFVPPRNRFGLFLRFVQSRFGKAMWDEKMHRFDGNNFNLRSDQDLFLQVDGEQVSNIGYKDIHYSVLPNAAKIFVSKG